MLGVKEIPDSVIKVRTELIENCLIINFNSDIKEIAIRIKQSIPIKLPDTIMAASALYMSMPLVTADKSFQKISDLDLRLLKL